jgi:capsular exopolysaccharide synthesis family protein
MMDGRGLTTAAENDWTIGTLITVFRRRRKLVLVLTGVMLALAGLYCCMATRRYMATGKIEVQKEDPGSFGLESSVMGRDESQVSSDSLDYNVTLQTEVEILQSDALALEVIASEQLEPTQDYFPRHSDRTASAWMSGIIAKLMIWTKPIEPASVKLSDAPNRRYKALKIFASRLKIKPVTGTRLIDVSYSDQDPQRAASVVNCLIGRLGEFSFKQRMQATVQGSGWLKDQLEQLEKKMEELQKKANLLQRDTGMFGNDASRNVVLQRLDSLNQTLEQAESNRILKEAIDRVAASGDPELISSLSGNSSVGAVASVNTSLTLIQSLRAQEALLREELDQDSIRYGTAYPKLGELRAQMQGVQQSIVEEVQRLGARAHTDYLISVREEEGARAAFDAQKEAAGRLNDSVVAYAVAKQEADSSRDLYETMLSKLQQAGVLEGMKANNIAVVGAAEVPPPNYPSSPKVPLILAAAFVAALMLGGGCVLLMELADGSIRSLQGLEQSLSVALIGVLPRAGRRSKRRLLGASRCHLGQEPDAPPRSPFHGTILENQTSSFAEGVWYLRTSLLLSRNVKPAKVILVTSCLAAEGKTTVAFSLSATLAQAGSRVLLVDADLRKPALWKYFSRESTRGLGEALADSLSVEVDTPISALPNFAVVCSAQVRARPLELLDSGRMRSLLEDWRGDYDFIVLDSPPVLPVADAAVLSTMSDATLLVARHGRTTRQALRRSVEVLRWRNGTPAALGIVLNDVSDASGDFYEYFGYQGGLYGKQTAHA